MQRQTLSLFALAATAGVASSQIAFDPPVSIPTGLQPGWTVAADLDGDGDLDLATSVDAQPDRVDIHLNDGLGAFTPGTPIFTGVSTSPEAIVAADLDGDGDRDLAIGLKDSNQVQIWFNSGLATFTVGTTAPTGSEPRDMVGGDWDGDGDVDLMVSNDESSNVTVMTNSGAGVFSSTNLTVGSRPRGIALGDWDGDGDMDAAVAVQKSQAVAVLTNNGLGGFTSASISLGALQPVGIAAGDTDGDGDLDLAAATENNAFHGVSLLTNTGGVFSGPVNVAGTGQEPSGIVAADLDLDGDVDLAINNENSHNMTLFENTGAGFTAANVVLGGTTPEQLVGADLDQNGGMDLIAVCRDSSELRWLRNQNGGVPGQPSITLIAPMQVGELGSVQIKSPGEAFMGYFCPFSFGTNGIPLGDGRVFPLSADDLFFFSLNPAAPIFSGVFGGLDANASAVVSLHTPNVPLFAGLKIYTAFAVIDTAQFLGIGTISDAFEMTIQP